MSEVSIVRTDLYDADQIASSVRKAVDLIGGMSSVVKPGMKVLIKPNLVAVPQERLGGAVTRWEVVLPIAEMVKEAGGEAIIAESAAAGVDTRDVIKFCEYDKIIERGFDVIDLKTQGENCKIPLENGLLLKELNSWKLVEEADVIISVPLMKTHDQTEVTLGIKNLKGLIQDPQKKWFHRNGVANGVVDISTALKPALCIIDGTFGQEGYGPLAGITKEIGLIMASKDIVACDAVAATVMGYDPREIEIIRIAGEVAGIGEMDLDKIKVLGEKVEDVKTTFKRPSDLPLEGLPDFNLIFTEGACTGCRNTVLSVLIDMRMAGTEKYLEGKTIIAGPIKELPADVRKEDLVLVGVCTKAFEEYGTWIQGCPPNNIFVHWGIAGKENVKSGGNTLISGDDEDEDEA